MAHVLLQRPVQMRERLGTAREPHPAAQVISALFAELAVFAHPSDLHCDAVAHFQRAPSRQVGSERGDDAAGFVAKNHGLADLEDAIGAVVVVVH